MNKKLAKIILELPDYLLIALYVYTASIKITNLSAFKIKLLKSPLIDARYVDLIAVSVPITEFVIVSLLLTRLKLVGHYLSVFLLSFFIGYLYILNNHSIYNGCGCGGIFEQLSLGQHIFVNFSLIIMSVGKIIFSQYHKANPSFYQIA